MLDLVDAGDLVLFTDAEADGLLDRRADDVGENERVGQDRECRDGLLAQLLEVSTIEDAADSTAVGLGGEEADQQRADESTDEVDADDVE